MLGSSWRARARLGLLVGGLVLVCASSSVAATLPDGRGYELVSPAEKHGLEVMGTMTRTHAAAGESSGSPAAVAFGSLGGFGDVAGSGVATEYLAQRTGTPGSSGWSVHGITPPQEPMTLFGLFQGMEPLYVGDMSADLTHALFRAWSPLTDAPNVAHVENLYRRDDLRTPGAGAYQLLSDAVSPLPAPDGINPLTPLARPSTAGATADFQHVLFETREPLTADARGVYVKLYKSDGPFTRLVAASSTCPGGATQSFGVPLPQGQCSGAGLVATAPRFTPRVLSADGSRTIFSAPVSAGSNLNDTAGTVSKLFQLDDQGTLDQSDDAVIQLNTSENPSPQLTQIAHYMTASVDGSRVFFLSSEQLTGTSGGGLYMWERQADDEAQALSVDATGGSFRLTFQTQLSTGTGSVDTGSDTVTGIAGSFVVGQTVKGDDIPPGTTILDIRNGTLRLSATATNSRPDETMQASTDTTTPALAHDASPAQVQSALEALSGIGTGNVSVTGGGGSYAITFTGALAGVNVAQLIADSSSLTGGASTATVTTTNDVHNLTLLTPLATTSATLAGEIGASEDGHRLYFAAAGAQLVPGGPPVGNFGVYYWQDLTGPPGGTISFIGEIDAGDMIDVINLSTANGAQLASRVSPDGRALVMQVADAGGLRPRYDQHSACPSGQKCTQVYIYHPDSSTPADPDIVCASCNPSGAPARDTASINSRVNTSGTAETWHVSHALSDDGQRVFFTSSEALVHEDINGRPDVYEYDVPTRAISLLSSGKSTEGSYFLDASADGHDVYFITRDQLVGWDTDHSYDLYDARVDGGFPEPAAPAQECRPDACQGATGTPPTPPALVSLGDARATPTTRRHASHRCRRGHVKRKIHGKTRCIKTKHHRHHKRHPARHRAH